MSRMPRSPWRGTETSSASNRCASKSGAEARCHLCQSASAIHTIIDLVEAERDGENVDHISLAVEADLDAVAASGEFDVDMEPRNLFGAQGVGPAMYVRDPDGNRIEFKAY